MNNQCLEKLTLSCLPSFRQVIVVSCLFQSMASPQAVIDKRFHRRYADLIGAMLQMRFKQVNFEQDAMSKIDRIALI